jgi:hypothetical protein
MVNTPWTLPAEPRKIPTQGSNPPRSHQTANPNRRADSAA